MSCPVFPGKWFKRRLEHFSLINCEKIGVLYFLCGGRKFPTDSLDVIIIMNKASRTSLPVLLPQGLWRSRVSRSWKFPVRAWCSPVHNFKGERLSQWPAKVIDLGSVFVWVLQRNRTNRCVCIYKWRDLLWGIDSWSFRGWEVPRSAVGRLETQESWWCKFQLETKSRRPVSQLKDRKRVNSPLLSLLFFAGFQLTWTQLTLGRALSFIQSSDLRANLTWNHPHRPTQNNV